MKYLETAFDDFVIKAVEEKLPSLTLDLATAYPYRLGASSIARLRKDSLAWGFPDNDYPIVIDKGA